jgi:uncharacterized RDD family membrane protein YckC
MSRAAVRANRGSIPRPNLVGHYAGPVSRTAAFAVDLAVASMLLAGGLRVLSSLVDFVFRTNVDYSDAPQLVGWAVLIGWLFLYFFVSWSLAGKTVGMALLGLRVVRRDGSDLDKAHALVRVIVYPFSFLLLGLGLVGILLGREHRALHDVAADTTVVYDWDARAARLRILAAGATAELAAGTSGGEPTARG